MPMWDREAVARQIAAPRRDDPAYLARRAIARALAAAAPAVGGGVLVDVGCGTRPYEPLFAPHVARYVGINHPPTATERPFYGAADLFADGAHLPLRDGSARTVLCTQVLEHVPEPGPFLREIARVLAPGGTLLTAPQTWGEHEVPRDFYRYTSWGLRHLLAGAGLQPQAVEPLEGLFATLGQMFLDELAWKTLGASRVRRGAIRAATSALNAACARLDRRYPTSRRLCLTYLAVAVKG